MRKRLSAEEYCKGILNGDRVVLSKAITIIESKLDSDKIIAKQILSTLTPFSGKSFRIGITGVPGVGKSTFIDSFGEYLINKGKKIAVLSIDPTSEKTKGAILGDKTRMEKLSVHPKAYIRPSASGNFLGGVANKTRETIILCEAAGYDTILIETVGVGQSEVDVKNITDFFLLLMLAGAGDELQGIKKGIIEMADLIAITKADGSNIKNSNLAKLEYENALHLFPKNENSWIPKVETCSALEKKGFDILYKHIELFEKEMSINNFISINRLEQKKLWFEQILKEKLLNHFSNHPIIQKELNEIELKLKKPEIDINSEADRIFKLFF